jgi:hypothetical protein
MRCADGSALVELVPDHGQVVVQRLHVRIQLGRNVPGQEAQVRLLSGTTGRASRIWR